MNFNTIISANFLYFFFFAIVVIAFAIRDSKSRFIIVNIAFIIFFSCYILSEDTKIVNYFIKNNYIEVKSTETLEFNSDLKIENKNGINYIIKVKDDITYISNDKVNLIYDLDENTKPYYTRTKYDGIMFKITVIDVHLNKNIQSINKEDKKYANKY